jgi:Zn finger protein HypA/HybF involved in hydrogenase expression
MHQAAVARRVADEIEHRQEPWSRVRVSLASADGSLEATADAIAAHLAAMTDGFDATRLDVVFARITRWCSACGDPFASEGDQTACPSCGGPALPVRSRDPVAIEFLVVDGQDLIGG